MRARPQVWRFPKTRSCNIFFFNTKWGEALAFLLAKISFSLSLCDFNEIDKFSIALKLISALARLQQETQIYACEAAQGVPDTGLGSFRYDFPKIGISWIDPVVDIVEMWHFSFDDAEKIDTSRDRDRAAGRISFRRARRADNS